MYIAKITSKNVADTTLNGCPVMYTFTLSERAANKFPYFFISWKSLDPSILISPWKC